jgi:hypothetical protein
MGASASKRPRSSQGFRLTLRRQLKGIEELADVMVGLGDVPHLCVTVQLVVVAPADLAAIDVPGGDEVGDDSVCRPFGDSDHIRDVPDPGVWIASDAQEYLCVV